MVMFSLCADGSSVGMASGAGASLVNGLFKNMMKAAPAMANTMVAMVILKTI